MGTQIRMPAGDAQRARSASSADSRKDADATSQWTYGEPALTASQDLVGAMFTTAKELRHLAERSFGELFVPVEVLDESAHTADYALRPGTLGPIVVHAERERHWYPFRVTRVEASQHDGESDEDPDRPRGARPYIGAHRPSIDWL